MKYILTLIISLLLVALIILVIVTNINYNENQNKLNDYSLKIDSLYNLLLIERNRFDSTRVHQDYIIDSLDKVKQDVIIKYEIKYKNHLDPTIISNDSIIEYISKKIYN